MKNIILNSLTETFKIIRKHKLLVLALFVLQAIFLSALVFVYVGYQFNIVDNIESLGKSFDEMELDDVAIAERMLNKEDILDMSKIYGDYDEIAKAIKNMLITSLLLFLVLNGINWAFTDYLIVKKNRKEFFAYFGKFILLGGAYGIVVLLLLMSFTRTLTDLMVEGNIGSDIIYLILSLVVAYFMFISIALIERVKLKDIFRKTFRIGVKKAHIIILAYIINIFVIGLFLVLTLLAVEMAFWLLLIATLLLFFSFVWARIFLIFVVNQLNKQVR